MSDVVDRLKEGDVFRWQYSEPDPEKDRPWGRYHCCSNIAIVNASGRLCDTYWMGSEGRNFGPEDLPRLKLTYIGNLSELDKAREYQADYYDDADIVNLNHSNSTRDNFYLRKGAQRSATKMLEVARRKLERSESDERLAARRSEELREAITRIEAGATDVYLF